MNPGNNRNEKPFDSKGWFTSMAKVYGRILHEQFKHSLQRTGCVAIVLHPTFAKSHNIAAQNAKPRLRDSNVLWSSIGGK
jgi:hypothetical protein